MGEEPVARACRHGFERAGLHDPPLREHVDRHVAGGGGEKSDTDMVEPC